MNVNLGDTLDQFITELLQTGLYQSQSEVVREGLRLLKEREDLKKVRITQLQNDLDKGIRQLESGEFETHDEKSLKKVFEESKARGRKKHAAKRILAA